MIKLCVADCLAYLTYNKQRQEKSYVWLASSFYCGYAHLQPGAYIGTSLPFAARTVLSGLRVGDRRRWFSGQHPRHGDGLAARSQFSHPLYVAAQSAQEDSVQPRRAEGQWRVGCGPG